MKKLIFTLCLLIPLIGIAQSNFHNTHYLDPYNPEYVKGEVLVKFKDKVKTAVKTKGNIAKTGIASVDKILEPYQTKAIQKIFKETREQRQKKAVKTIRDFKGNKIEVPALYNIYKLKFDTVWDAKQIVTALQKDKNIDFAEPNYLVYTNDVLNKGYVLKNQQPVIVPSNNKDSRFTPNDPLYNQQSAISQIQVDQVWDTVTGDSTQIIAILDTGVDWTHPDLTDNIWTNWDEVPGNGMDDDNNGMPDDVHGWDFINNDNNPMDDNSHGTHVAGIAAARGNNGIGIAGVNWHAKILPVKVFPASGSTDAATITQGIEYASNNGATVLNMSFGSFGRSFIMEVALQNAYLTADLVAAAGNSHKSIYPVDPMFPTTEYPAALSYVLGVESSTGAYSNYDPDGPIKSTFAEGFNYELKAPGSGIISTLPGGGYGTMTGTSMSTPFVSGAISLYRTQFPTASKEKLWGDFIHTISGSIKVFDAFYSNDVQPVFDVSDYAIEDTLSGNDQDGQADAGELIQVYTTIRNTWGPADSLYALLSYSIYGDTNDLSFVHDSVFFGNISTYGTLTNLSDPFLIRIDSNCFNNRVVTLDVTMRNAGDTVSYTQGINFRIYNGEELSGILTSDTTLTPDKLWVVNNNLRIDTGVTLSILPGTHLEINAGFDNRGYINAIGSEDSMIYVEGFMGGDGYCKYVDFDCRQGVFDMDTSTIDHCNIHNLNGYITVKSILNCKIFDSEVLLYSLFQNVDTVASTEIRNIELASIFSSYKNSFLDKCLFDNILMWNYGFQESGSYKIRNCVFNNFINASNYYTYAIIPLKSNYVVEKNSFLTKKDGAKKIYFVRSDGSANYQNFPDQYWGTVDTNKIRKKYYDFYNNVGLPILNINPFLTAPSDSCPGHVWKVLVNGKDAQDETVDPVSVGLQKFEVYFNRAMDTTVTPMLSFGLRDPFFQNVVKDSASWSSDKKVWTAYFTTHLLTGDGTNTIRVANAVDSLGFTIPVEKDRFKFVIQATGVQSVNFIATPGIGKVDLEWNNTGLVDFLGFNMYRYMDLTDSTHSTPEIINTSLIADTVFTDFNVIPDSTYHYYYKVVNTDLTESDSSRIASATPFSTATGDANGDLSVSVLDITTIVSYMLNQNPNPFLFDAADVNYDNEINVLDIIGVVQLINSKKSLPIKPLPVFSKEVAYYDMDNDLIKLESKGNIQALQFKLKAKNKNFNTKVLLKKIRIFSKQAGFEFSYAVVDDYIIGILYNLTEKKIPEGITTLFKVEGIDNDNIEIVEIFGGDSEGNYVPILKKGTQASVIADDAELQASPNPFRDYTNVNYTVPENGLVNLKLYNLSGRLLNEFVKSYRSAGNYTLLWNGTDQLNHKLKKGIYILQLTVNTDRGKEYHAETKVVLIK